MKELSLVEISVVAKEIAVAIRGARISKVYQPSRKSIAFQLHTTAGKRMLVIQLPGLVYLAEEKEEMPTAPSGFCQRLRKHIEGGIIEHVEQLGRERIIALRIKARGTTASFIAELFGQGNIILTDSSNIAIAVLETQESKERDGTMRTIAAGKEYAPPKNARLPLVADKNELYTLLRNHPDWTISKRLAVDLGLGKNYGYDVCVDASVGVQETTVTEKQQEMLYDSYKELFSHVIVPAIVKKKKERGKEEEGKEKEEEKEREERIIDAVPWKLHMYALANMYALADGEFLFEEKRTFSEALCTIAKEDERTQSARHQHHNQHHNQHHKNSGEDRLREIEKLKETILLQDKNVARLERESKELQRAGELLYERYADVEEVLNAARAHRKSDELLKKLKEHPCVVGLEKKGEIVVEL